MITLAGLNGSLDILHCVIGTELNCVSLVCEQGDEAEISITVLEQAKIAVHRTRCCEVRCIPVRINNCMLERRSAMQAVLSSRRRGIVQPAAALIE